MKYYSFKLGFDHQKPSNWLHEDYKIPAQDLKTAIIVHYWITVRGRFEFRKRVFWEKTQFSMPCRSYIELYYQQIIEYEKAQTTTRGHSVQHFKKIKIYNSKHFGKLFDIRKS